MIFRLILTLMVFLVPLRAEKVKSATGNILFDSDNDAVPDIRVNANGFAIGPNLSPSANLHLQGNAIISKELIIGGVAGNSSLEVQGTLGFGVESLSSNTTLSGNSHILVDSSSDNIDLSLPYAGNVTGRIYLVKKTSTSNQVTLSGGGNNIDAHGTYTFTSGNVASLKVISNGIQWYVISQSDQGLSATSWTPAEITTTMWLDADDASTLTVVSGAISQWNDKSGNDFHVTQGTSSRRPVYNATGWSNGRAQLEMDELTTTQAHTLGRTVTSDGISGSAYTLFLVVNARTTDTEGWPHTANDTAGKENRFQINNNGVKVRSDGSNGGSATASYTSGEQILQFTLDSTASEVYRNGTQVASNSGTFTGSALTGDFTINGRNSSDGHAGMDGDFAEFIYLTRNPSTSERQKIEGYLAHKWGLEGSLPAGHPYKSSAP